MKAPALCVGFIQPGGASAHGVVAVFHGTEVGVHHCQKREPKGYQSQKRPQPKAFVILAFES